MTSDFHPPGANPAHGETDADAGVPAGTWTSLYPTGELAATIDYDADGHPTGTARQYRPDGTDLLRVRFSENGDVSVQTNYHDNGQPETRQAFVKSIPHGPVMVWHRSGAIAAEGAIHTGRPHGRCVSYAEDGTVVSDQVFDFGIIRSRGFALVSVLGGGQASVLVTVVFAIVLGVLILRGSDSLNGILLLAAIIVIHEFGHWLVAKLAGMPMESFRVGIGPHLLSFMFLRTRFELHLIPLMGWVRPGVFWPGEWEQFQLLEGSDQPATGPTGREGFPTVEEPPATSDSFRSWPRRAAFLLGGIGMNLLCAVLALWLSGESASVSKAIEQGARLTQRAATSVPEALTEQLNPKNYVEDQPTLLRQARDAKASGMSIARFFIALNIVIAVFNLLPVPPLDGYRLVVCTLESVLGRKLDGPIFRTLSRVGMLFLAVLIVSGVFFLGRDLIQMLRGR